MRRLPQLTKLVLASLIFIPILQIAAGSTAQASIVSRGLIMRWDAKNPASYPGTGSTWKDISGNGHDATLYNGVSTTCTPPYTGANSCAGSNSETVATGVRMPVMEFYNQSTASSSSTGKYASVPTFSLPTGDTQLSVTFYANFGTPAGGGWDRIIDFGKGQLQDNIVIARNGSSTDLTGDLIQGTTDVSYCTDTSTISNSAWAFYAFVFTGSICKVYKNNLPPYSQTYAESPTNVSRTLNYIGRSNWNADNMYSGGIADLAIYSVALTDTEVAQNYTEQTSAQVLSITSTPPSPIIQGVTSYTFTDTSTSQLLPVRTIDSGSTSICSITGNTVNFIGAGTCKINSTQPGNTNYSAAATISQSFTVNANTTVSVSLSGNATYRQIASLTATVAPVTGRITFYAQGKAIPGCKNVLVSSSPFVCSWKASQHNSVTITATYDPTPTGYSTVTSSPTAINVVARTGTR